MTGHRIAVTTAPGPGADRSIGLVRDTGMTPVHLPCIEIVPGADERIAAMREAADRADWLVITSRRVVEILWPDGGMPRRPAVAAVGPSTATAVRRAGGRAAVVGKGGAAHLREVLAGEVDGSVVAFPHAEGADPETARWLGQHAAELAAAPVYSAIPTAPGDDPVDAVIFGSPSAVEGWSRSRSLEGMTIAAIGFTTAARLEAEGRRPDVVPRRPDLEILVEDLAARLTDDEKVRR